MLLTLICGLSHLDAQTTIWEEDFESYSANEGVTSNGPYTYTPSNGKWTIETGSSPDHFKVKESGGDSHLEAKETDGLATWTSEAIDMTGVTSGTLSFWIDVVRFDNGSNGDVIDVQVSYDGSGFTTGYEGNKNTDGTYSVNLDVCSQLQIRVNVDCDNNNEQAKIDDVKIEGCRVWYADTDGDGFGDASNSTSACIAPSGYVSDSTDCDDSDSAVGGPTVWYADDDGDGYGDANDSQSACSAPSGYVSNGADCDDTDNAIVAAALWYNDADGDGLGDLSTELEACSQPAGYVSNSNDESDNHIGTVLSPGDIFFTYGNHGEADAGNEEPEAYVAFVTMVDLTAGTQVALSPKLEWEADGDDLGWSNEEKGTVIWTAPAGGVQAGSEVMLFDIKDEATSGTAYTHEPGNPIVRSGASAVTMTGGVACGTYQHVSSEREDFHKKHMWIFQPGSNGIDDNPRHLSCMGKQLDDGDNVGDGTLLYAQGETANLDLQYCLELESFEDKSWAYSGPKALGAIQFDGSSQTILTRTLDAAAPEFLTTSSNYSFDDDDDQLNFEPIGNFALTTDYDWSAVASSDTDGDETLDITLNEEVALVVDVVDVVETRNITLNKGTFQSCDGNARTVAASGDITLGATGMFNGGQGTLEFNGLSDQFLDAGDYDTPDSEKVRLKKVKIKEGKKVKFKGHVKMKPGGALEFDDDANVSGDKLEIDSSVSSSLTFQSTSEGTAAIGPCEASNFEDGTSQEFTFERFVPADTDNSWVNIAPYVTGTTAANWTDSIAGALIFKYVETSYGSLAAGWQYVWNSSEVLTPGTGYMALIPANTSGTFSVTGTFQMGDVDIALTFTDDLNQSNSAVDGWNLVANPYPAPVNLPQVLADNDLVESYYIFDNTGSGSYRETLDDGSGDAPTILDVGQSFWVKVTQATTITFSESDKVVDGSNTFLREFDPGFEGSLGLHVENVEDQWSNAFISFHEEATPDFNHEEDAVHLDTELLNQLRMWTVAETGEHLAIQSLGSVATTPSVPLHMTTGAGGEITFELFEQDLMPENYCMVVEDTETGEKAQMGVETLTVNVPAETLYEGRFVLHFNAMPAMELTSTTCDGLDIAELEGDWDAWDVAWESTDGEMSGDGFPYDLPNGEYVFTYANGLSGCANAIPASVQDACLGDFNANGTRDITDLMVLLAGMPGSGGASVLGADVADCNCDGLVTIEDILTFLSVFSSACEE